MAGIRGKRASSPHKRPADEVYSQQNLLKSASPNGDEMLLNGKAPFPGQIVKLPNLARTFRELGIHGKDGFYKGRIAQAIVDVIQSKGGVMELEDLAKHETSIVEPISYTYGNEVTVYEVGSKLFFFEVSHANAGEVSSQWSR